MVVWYGAIYGRVEYFNDETRREVILLCCDMFCAAFAFFHRMLSARAKDCALRGDCADRDNDDHCCIACVVSEFYHHYDNAGLKRLDDRSKQHWLYRVCGTVCRILFRCNVCRFVAEAALFIGHVGAPIVLYGRHCRDEYSRVCV